MKTQSHDVEDDIDDRARKRQRLSDDEAELPTLPSVEDGALPPISPPGLKRKIVKVHAPSCDALPLLHKRYLCSPIQLTHIRDLPAAENVHTVTLNDIVGDPLIKECWSFNFMTSVDFLMAAFDQDVRHLVDVKVIHGYWKHEDPSRRAMEDDAKRYPNVKLIAAEVREFYGTHHTKMMVMFRHDDTAQVIIHTANLIHQDWTNLTQAVWRSPLLPLLASDSVDLPASSPPAMGTGHRFKHDLLQYFLAYGRSRTGRLVDLLIRHDFAAVRAAFVASVPGRHATIPSAGQTHWGWKGLQEVLRHVPSSNRDNRPVIVSQVSSIASLGTTDTWLTAFFDTLRTTQSPKNGLQPTCRIIFPTEDEVRRSLDGYRAGASIHLKTSSATGIKQLQYLRPSLCRWGEAVVPASAAQTLLGFTKPSDQPSTKTEVVRQAGRCRAAPHIKTYIRFTDSSMSDIDWAMVTSANLSKQAWGEGAKNNEVRICSWEAGVIVWPELFQDHPGKDHPGNQAAQAIDGDAHARIRMMPVFKRDTPAASDEDEGRVGDVIGLRMPYDLPLVPYSPAEMPWCAADAHDEPDWKGVTWPGWQR